MAKKRRKIDKIRAQKRLAEAAKNATAKNATAKNTAAQDRNSLKTAASPAVKPIDGLNKTANLFNYDPQLISQDLKKTLLISLVILVVLALITLRYT
ncbi:MAG TPA: hypothetical protein PKL32_00815 [Candidatus Woesebacteria bacterium]|nr:hypothetical protein [Candidatus Woesebacteria bacterium]